MTETTKQSTHLTLALYEGDNLKKVHQTKLTVPLEHRKHMRDFLESWSQVKGGNVKMSMLNPIENVDLGELFDIMEPYRQHFDKRYTKLSDDTIIGELTSMHPVKPYIGTPLAQNMWRGESDQDNETPFDVQQKMVDTFAHDLNTVVRVRQHCLQDTNDVPVYVTANQVEQQLIHNRSYMQTNPLENNPHPMCKKAETKYGVNAMYLGSLLNVTPHMTPHTLLALTEDESGSPSFETVEYAEGLAMLMDSFNVIFKPFVLESYEQRPEFVSEHTNYHNALDLTLAKNPINGDDTSVDYKLVTTSDITNEYLTLLHEANTVYMFQTGDTDIPTFFMSTTYATAKRIAMYDTSAKISGTDFVELLAEIEDESTIEINNRNIVTSKEFRREPLRYGSVNMTSDDTQFSLLKAVSCNKNGVTFAEICDTNDELFYYVEAENKWVYATPEHIEVELKRFVDAMVQDNINWLARTIAEEQAKKATNA